MRVSTRIIDIGTGGRTRRKKRFLACECSGRIVRHGFSLGHSGLRRPHLELKRGRIETGDYLSGSDFLADSKIEVQKRPADLKGQRDQTRRFENTGKTSDADPLGIGDFEGLQTADGFLRAILTSATGGKTEATDHDDSPFAHEAIFIN